MIDVTYAGQTMLLVCISNVLVVLEKPRDLARIS